MTTLAETSPVTVPAPARRQGTRPHRHDDGLRRARAPPCSTRAGLDVLLVGDSVEMAVYGKPNTLSATMETRCSGTRKRSPTPPSARSSWATCPSSPTRRTPRRPCTTPDASSRKPAAGRSRSRAGRRILPAVEAILAADIPVMGHVGLTPQSYRKFGGFKVQGKAAGSRAGDPRGRARPRAGRLLRGRPRMRAGRAGGPDHVRDRRRRRSESAAGPPAMARSSSSTTSSG